MRGNASPRPHTARLRRAEYPPCVVNRKLIKKSIGRSGRAKGLAPWRPADNFAQNAGCNP
nr:MAG TPA: hypothetical protein [Caudoviricetes sp.]